MPDTPSTTLIHYSPAAQTGGPAACGTKAPSDGEFAGISARPSMVTCFACRRSPEFHVAQTEPLPQRHAPVPLTPPVKLSGVMQQHPVLPELYAAALDYTEQDAPRYRHECSDCEYLGHTNNSHSDGTIKRVELYYCHADDLGDVVARHSDGFGDWVRGYTRSTWDPDLALAVVRAIHKGLFRANALHFL